MSFDGRWQFAQGLCDLCGRSRLVGLAESLCEPNVMVNGRWTDDKFTKEKSKKWATALEKAENQLRTSCAVFYTADCDQGQLCKNCIVELLSEWREYGDDSGSV